LPLSSDSHTEPPSTPDLRIKAIQQLLMEKGLLPPGAIDAIVDAFEHKLGPKIGAKIVAHGLFGCGGAQPLTRQCCTMDAILENNYPNEA